MPPPVTPNPTPTPTPTPVPTNTTATPPPPGGAPNLPINALRGQAPSGDLIKDIVKLRMDMNAVSGFSKDLAKHLGQASENLKFSFELGTDVKHTLDDTRNIASKIGREYVDQELIQERINFNKNESLAIEEALENTLQALGKTRNDLASELSRIEADILANQTAQPGVQQAIITADEIALVNLKKQLDTREQIENKLDDINSKLAAGNNLVKEAQVKASALGRIFQSLTGIPFLKDFMDFKKISDAFGKSTKEGFGALREELGRIIKSPLFLLVAGLTIVIGLVRSLIKATLEFDKQLTQVANNLGFAKESSIGLLDNFRAISVNNEVLVKGLERSFLSVKNQALATAELQEILETNSLLSARMVQSQILLTKQMGLSKEEAAGIQKFSLLTGRSADSILQSAIKQNNTAISYRKIISEVAKVSSEIAVMYKNNPDLIAKAVVQANKLGISLEQSKQISKSLLDFETSISGELEAELLTGRRFNFEKARALALDGKSVEAAQELLGQMGGLNELTKLNVIQRDRLAASIGMSAEELTKAAREAEILTQLGFENRDALEEQYELLRQRNDKAGMAALMEEARKKEGGEILLQDIARANLQQRFEESVERIKQIFTEMAAGPLTKILSGIASMLENTTLLKGLLIGAAALFGAIAVTAWQVAAAITVASGGTNLLGAAAAGALVVGGSAFLGMSMLGGANEDTDFLQPPGSAKPTTPSTGEDAYSSTYSADRMKDMQTRVSGLEAQQVYQSNNNRTQSLQADVENLKNTTAMASPQMITANSPQMSTMPQVPYGAPAPAAASSATPEDAYKDSFGSNTDKKIVIENKTYLTLDSKQVATALKNVDYALS